MTNGYGWLWLVVDGHGQQSVAMEAVDGYGWLWLVVDGHGQQSVAMEAVDG